MITYAPKARVDLRGMWLYTAENWDPDQADAYLKRIESTCERLADGSLTGVRVEIAGRSYLKYPVASHVVFYRLDPDGIEIIRILHQRMDVSRHLYTF